MENRTSVFTQLIANSYKEHHRSVYLYIYYRIGSKEEAEDLAQDVFVRLMEYKQLLLPETTKFLLFTIAKNLVNDYFRSYYRKQEMNSYMYEQMPVCSNDTESGILADDLATHERNRMKLLPAQRRTIYTMSRFEEKSVADISTELHLSHRTVENHLRIGRKEVREYIRRCI